MGRYDSTVELTVRNCYPWLWFRTAGRRGNSQEQWSEIDMTANSRGYRPSDFAQDLHRHMLAWAGFAGNASPYWIDWTDGIQQDHRRLALETVKADSVSLHNYAAHIRSSQVFAFNLFLPFREGRREELSHRVGALVDDELTIDRVAFEWVPPGHLLCEIDGERPGPEEPSTAVDVILWGWRQNGRRAAVLVEVKLTEDGFTRCKGRTSRENHRTDVCQSARLFLDNPQDCYLRRPVRKERDRRYWSIFAKSNDGLQNTFPNADPRGECPFAYDMYQPMRNLAVARGLEQEDLVEKAWFVLCAHDANPDVTHHWQAWQNLVGGSTLAPFLPASEIIAVGESSGLADWGKYMRDRYRL